MDDYVKVLYRNGNKQGHGTGGRKACSRSFWRFSYFIVQLRREIDKALLVVPLVEENLRRTVGDDLKRILQIEANVRLQAEFGVDFSREERNIALRCPLPKGQNFRVLGAQRGYVLGIGRDCNAYDSMLMRVEVGLNRNA